MRASLRGTPMLRAVKDAFHQNICDENHSTPSPQSNAVVIVAGPDRAACRNRFLPVQHRD
jgi:hypothetical protein